ncbi:uncharacterized protein BO87DRAFT_432342 [Aspergillus neoniger CBS 115656]|uniref:Uncharacterized protein n=1 Tax=Aspergillus neoniger (strain CBS 115656) TaxID=1448310 RepID=A0A318ZHP2_ASPNB|nr:hypothetical protein BO87DRAFT_432342 [Aspergillus neoniger CBS 115656]PYH39748.1 hypothetical protein BO87DRAFT_432342 [Aspergillus neoniger CBS 115656]
MPAAESMFPSSVPHEFCISEDLSELQPNQKPPPSLREARLPLLRPLEKADILELCTQSPSTHTDGYKSMVEPEERNLDLQPLSKLWRQEMMKLPPFAKIIFDLTLPLREDQDAIVWDIGKRREGCYIVRVREVMHIATTIALTTRVRLTGGAVSFDLDYEDLDLVYDDRSDEIVSCRLDALREEIRALGTAPTNEVKGGSEGAGVGGQSSDGSAHGLDVGVGQT